jgi:hypothetical protein
LTANLARYERIAPFYDLLDLPFERRRYHALRPILFQNLKGRLLDAGIGTGRNCAFYPRRRLSRRSIPARPCWHGRAGGARTCRRAAGTTGWTSPRSNFRPPRRNKTFKSSLRGSIAAQITGARRARLLTAKKQVTEQSCFWNPPPGLTPPTFPRPPIPHPPRLE